MAITENNFTEAEFVSAIDANPALAAVIRTGLGSKKYVVQDETEHQEFLKNYKDTAYKKQIIDEHTSEFAPKLEKDIKELTGIDKASQDEKYFDYLKRAVGAKLGTLKQMETELEKLKSGHAPSEADKLRIAQLEKGIEEKETEWSEKYSKKETELNEVKVGGKIEVALSKIRPKYKAGLPESMVKLTEQTIAADVMRHVKIQEDGTETVVDDNGEILLDKTTYKPKTIDAVITEKLADMIDPGKKATGTGTGKDDANGDEGKETKFTGVPAGVTTRVQLSDYLLKLGIADGSEEFDKILDEHGKNLKLR